ncbi:hypothetical protein BV25DRAFT_1548545 [Artomyces pyxidatus]|uniref:Uncharacterized protein n=1 Tax=Artomyces pyxidatus TaxID=48021 RepID=A0ACB8SJM8_9AGAM|nr:hypothetical protein BV25DRAFT_1548545 [Artomyces pyxidatus]
MSKAAGAPVSRHVPPSSFASMLRRSAFASYDPQIAQVYTTSRANAHRGNWGLKRALAPRRTGQHITVQAVDSREQQTEWRPGTQESRFIQRWPELGVDPIVRGRWRDQLPPGWQHQWLTDSEFAAGERAGPLAPPPPRIRPAADAGPSVRSLQQMSDREYARHLAALRAQRPSFQAFLAAQAAAAHAEPAPDRRRQHTLAPTAYGTAVLRGAHDAHRLFLKGAAAPALAPQPHRTAGAQYALDGKLTHYLSARALPGRYVSAATTSGAPVAVAGVMAAIGGIREPPTVRPRFRATGVVLAGAPAVVGAREGGLRAARIEMWVREVSRLEKVRNMHLPGTREWIIANEKSWSKRRRKMTKKGVVAEERLKRRNPEEERKADKEMFEMLSKIIVPP